MSRWSDQLKDPRWQKVRLERLEAANWTCERCDTKTETLHCHHIVYKRGREPWDYEPCELAVLCEKCHDKWHDEHAQYCLFELFKVLDDDQFYCVLKEVTTAAYSWSASYKSRRWPQLLMLDAAYSAIVERRMPAEMDVGDRITLTMPIHQFDCEGVQ